MTHTKATKENLRKKLKKYLNTFIIKNTFTLKELQLLEKNIQPFSSKNRS